MAHDKESQISVEELTILFKQKKDKLKKINTNIRIINTQLIESLKTYPKLFSQVSNEQKKQHLVLTKKIKELEISECDTRESIKRLAVKISKKKKTKEGKNGK